MKKILDFTHLYSKNNNVLYILLTTLLSFTLLSIIYLTGGTHLGTSSIMFIPILLLSIRFHMIGGMISGIIFGLILWFVIPLDVRLQMMSLQNTSITRMIIFIVFGIVSGYFFKLYERRNYTSKLVLSKMNNAYCFIDPKGIVRYYNKSFYEYLKDILDLNQFENKDIKNKKLTDILVNSSYADGKSLNSLVMNHISKKRAQYDFQLNVSFKDKTFVLNHRIDSVILDNSFYGVLLSIKDYKAKHEMVESIEVVKNVDELTGLYNRNHFNHFVSELPLESYPHGFIILHVDNLKGLFQTFGRNHCDDLLKKVASVIKCTLSEKSFCARYDTNEFIIYQPTATHENMYQTINKVLRELEGKIDTTLSYGYYIRESLLVSPFNSISRAKQNMILYKNVKSNLYSDNSINIIMKVLHEKDTYSEIHSKSVGHISRELAIRCGIPMNQVTEIWYAALLHDIGKIVVPDEILQKVSKLSDTEYTKMKEHSETGYRLLEDIEGMKNIANIVRSHHERFDGCGYPRKTKGDTIPLGSRIISIADSYNAIVTDRPYRSKKDDREALQEIIRCSGTQFDPNLTKIFEEHFEDIISLEN